jgi:hypothetical protein
MHSCPLLRALLPLPLRGVSALQLAAPEADGGAQPRTVKVWRLIEGPTVNFGAASLPRSNAAGDSVHARPRPPPPRTRSLSGVCFRNAQSMFLLPQRERHLPSAHGHSLPNS